jgi:hypothetical protein
MKKQVAIRSSAAEYLTFIAATGEGGVEAVYADENIWLSQKMMALLYDVSVPTINEHLKKIFDDMELTESSTIRKFRIVQTEGKRDVSREVELESLGRIVTTYLDYAELQATRHIPMTMQDWAKRLDAFLKFTEYEILHDAGKVSAEIAKSFAESEFEKYRIVQDKLYRSDFDRLIEESGDDKKGKRNG